MNINKFKKKHGKNLNIPYYHKKYLKTVKHWHLLILLKSKISKTQHVILRNNNYSAINSINIIYNISSTNIINTVKLQDTSILYQLLDAIHFILHIIL